MNVHEVQNIETWRCSEHQSKAILKEKRDLYNVANAIGTLQVILPFHAFVILFVMNWSE